LLRKGTEGEGVAAAFRRELSERSAIGEGFLGKKLRIDGVPRVFLGKERSIEPIDKSFLRKESSIASIVISFPRKLFQRGNS